MNVQEMLDSFGTVGSTRKNARIEHEVKIEALTASKMAGEHQGQFAQRLIALGMAESSAHQEFAKLKAKFSEEISSVKEEREKEDKVHSRLSKLLTDAEVLGEQDVEISGKLYSIPHIRKRIAQARAIIDKNDLALTEFAKMAHIFILPTKAEAEGRKRGGKKTPVKMSELDADIMSVEIE